MCLDAQHQIHSAKIDLKSDATQVLIGFLSTGLIHYIFEKYVFRPLANWCFNPSKSAKSAKKRGKLSQEDLKQLETMKHKFCTSAWKFVSYAFFVGYGIYALKDQQAWLWNPSQYPFCYPNNQMPHLLHLYYIMATSYYAYSSISIFFEPKMKDRNEMLLHHGVTLSLLVSSYLGNVTKYGLAILLLHDIADPWMEVAKLCFYNKLKMMSNIFFVIFASTFIYTRVYIFPRFIIWPIATHELKEHYQFFWPTVICLSTLALLHVFWSFLILRVLTESVLGDGKKGDVREEE